MIKDIKGLHHITSIADNAAVNNRFFTETLGLRRVKKTVNFDSPDTYHFYYGDAEGSAGTVMTYFPFGAMPRGTRGVGEVGVTEFAVPEGGLGYWQDRLSAKAVQGLARADQFGQGRLLFDGPDGDSFALVESPILRPQRLDRNGCSARGRHSGLSRRAHASARCRRNGRIAAVHGVPKDRHRRGCNPLCDRRRQCGRCD